MIYHICTKVEYYKAVTDGELISDMDFLHCATIEQVEGVANSFFKGKENIYLLTIDEKKVKAEIRYEGKYQGYHYPHIYGPLNMDAVVKAEELEAERGGTFLINFAL